MDTLGVNVWWTVHRVRIDLDEARSIARKHGFDDDDIRKPTTKCAFGRAAKTLNDGRNHRLARPVSDGPGQAVIGIVNETVNGDKLKYRQDTTAKLDKASGTVQATGQYAKRFIKEYNEFLDVINEDDVRAFLRRAIDRCYGTAKRPKGGIYFVPENYVGIIRSAAAVIEELDAGKLYVERVGDGVEERENVWDAARAEIEKKVNETILKAERIEKRVSSLKNHKGDLSGIRELMDVYASLLEREADAEDLKDMLSKAGRSISRKIGKLSGKNTGKAKVKA